MKTTLFAIFAMVVTLGFAYAYAEPYEDTVRFDLFNNATVAGSGCSFIDEEGSFFYNCKWFIETTNSTQFIEEMLEDFVETVEEIKEEQGIADETLDIPEVIVPQTPTERLIEDLKEQKERGTISTADKELLRLLEATQIACELGIEHGERLQSYGNFALPEIDPRIETATDYTTNYQLGKIVKKFEECEAWNEYRFTVLGQQYLDMEVDDSTSQKTHREMVQSLETFPVPRLNDHDFAEAEKQAQEHICSASYYDRFFKAEKGCFDDVELEDRNLPNLLDRNPSYTAYKEYMSAGTVDLASLKKQEVEKAHIQSLESFALQHGIDIDVLKNLVQPVDEYNKQKIQEGQK